MILNKKHLITTLLLLFMLIVSSCSNKEKQNMAFKEINAEDIIIDASFQEDLLKVYGSIEEQMKDASVSIYGEIIDFSYNVSENGYIYTKETVKIIESITGNYKPGTIVYVVKAGGIVTIKDYINSFEESYRPDMIDFMGIDLADSDSEQKYIEHTNFDGMPTRIKMKSIYILGSINSSKDEFFRIAESKSQYAQLPDGTFLEPNTISYDEACANAKSIQPRINSTIESKEKLSPDDEIDPPPITSTSFNEIVAKIQAS